MKNKYQGISILGAGSWGGTIAWILRKKNYRITLWTPIKNEYDFISRTRTLIRPKKIKLSNNIHITQDLSLAIKSSQIIIIAVPTNAFKITILKIKKLKPDTNKIFVSATKGITTKEHLRPSQIIKRLLPKNPHAVLSGPNIALDVTSGSPVISVIATNNYKTGKDLQRLLSTETFRIYLNEDINGVEIAGALKNVIAIASGMTDGLGFNISTKAALISRGLTEIARLVKKEKGNPKTLLGASGIGDLIATCCSPNSRNYRVGYELAKGKKLKVILSDLGQVAEGTETVKAMMNLAKKYRVEVPIASSIYDVIYRDIKPKHALKNLLKRPLGAYEIEF